MIGSKGRKSVLGKIFGLLLDIVIVFVCLIVVFLLYYIISSQIHSKDPSYKPNIGIYTIVSPSMDPVIKVYDVVVNKKVNNPDEIQVGDIITYISTNAASEGMTITHRVIEINKVDDKIYEYRTQGDNNAEPDLAYVTFDNVLGKEIMIVPKLGRLQFLLANKKGWLFLLLIPVLAYIFVDIYRLISLLGLNKKVTKVIETDRVIKEEKEEQHKQEEIRKETIKRELKEIEPQIEFIDEYQKNPKENLGFLETYNEQVFTVGDIKETKINIVVEEEPKEEKNIALIAKENAIVSPLIANEITMKTIESSDEVVSDEEDIVEEVITPPEIEEPEVEEVIEEPEIEEVVEEEPIVIEQPKVINENIEILDTDELSSTIKKYTEKITELNNQIAALDKLHKEEKERIEKAEQEAREKAEAEIKAKELEAKLIEEQELAAAEKKEEAEKFVETDNYLRGGKIKVVKQEVAKKPRSKGDKVKPKIEEKIELKSASLYNKNKPVRKIERPKGVDVRTVNADINPVKSTPKKEESKKKLNLNPSTIKKVNRAPKKDATPTRKKVVAKTKNKKKVGTRKREKLIVIEKRK